MYLEGRHGTAVQPDITFSCGSRRPYIEDHAELHKRSWSIVTAKSSRWLNRVLWAAHPARDHRRTGLSSSNGSAWPANGGGTRLTGTFETHTSPGPSTENSTR